VSAALRAAGAAYLAARRAYQDALEQVQQTRGALVAAEQGLIEGVMDHDSEDSATAFVCDGVVLMVKPEYWDLPTGERIAMERLLPVGS
jgi:hypothetical protein